LHPEEFYTVCNEARMAGIPGRNEPDDDDAVAVSDHGDMLDKSADTCQPGQQRSNNKLT
jgi:hypothetical protein